MTADAVTFWASRVCRLPARHRDALLAAWEAGLAVDRERFGADIGTDGRAQMVEMLLADVEEEVHGAVGMVRE